MMTTDRMASKILSIRRIFAVALALLIAIAALAAPAMSQARPKVRVGGNSSPSTHSSDASVGKGPGRGPLEDSQPREPGLYVEKSGIDSLRKIDVLAHKRFDSDRLHVVSLVQDSTTNDSGERLLGERFSTLESGLQVEQLIAASAGKIVFVIAHIENDDIVARDSSGNEITRISRERIAALERENDTPIVVLGCEAGGADVSGTSGYINTVDALEQVGRIQGRMSVLDLFLRIAGSEHELLIQDSTVMAIEGGTFDVVRIEAVDRETGGRTQMRVYYRRPMEGNKTRTLTLPEEGITEYSLHWLALCSIALVAFSMLQKIASTKIPELYYQAILFVFFSVPVFANWLLAGDDYIVAGLWGLAVYWIVYPAWKTGKRRSEEWFVDEESRKVISNFESRKIDHGTWSEQIWEQAKNVNIIGALRKIENTLGVRFSVDRASRSAARWFYVRRHSLLSKINCTISLTATPGHCYFSVRVRHVPRAPLYLLVVVIGFFAFLFDYLGEYWLTGRWEYWSEATALIPPALILLVGLRYRQRVSQEVEINCAAITSASTTSADGAAFQRISGFPSKESGSAWR